MFNLIEYFLLSLQSLPKEKTRKKQRSMGTAAEALEKNLVLAERRFRDIVSGSRPYDGEKIELLMSKLMEAYDALVEHEHRLIKDLEKLDVTD